MPLFNPQTKTINAYWMKTPYPGNFGDILTPWLIKRMCGYTCVYQEKPFIHPTLLAVGSIVQNATGNIVVWGSGIIKDGYLRDTANHATYLAVRGPLTRDVLLAKGINCPSIFGDPALLLPRLYPKTPTYEFELGIFAHYVDKEIVKKRYADKNVIIIDPINSDITSVIDTMLRCKKIISSSLHGIIVSQAYGIPACWVKFTDLLFGDGIKFRDYFQSVNISMECIDLREYAPVDDLLNLHYTKDIQINLDPLLKSFPIT